jgi:hypothetical protein
VIYSQDGSALPHDGIAGFSGQIVPGFNQTPFFHTLCNEGHVAECRFGFALESNATGKQILGGVDRSLFQGELSVTPIIQEWFLLGDIAVNDKILLQDALIELDSGTANIIG